LELNKTVLKRTREKFLDDLHSRDFLWAHEEGAERSANTTCHSSMLGECELICMDANLTLAIDRD